MRSAGSCQKSVNLLFMARADFFPSTMFCFARPLYRARLCASHIAYRREILHVSNVDTHLENFF